MDEYINLDGNNLNVKKVTVQAKNNRGLVGLVLKISGGRIKTTFGANVMLLVLVIVLIISTGLLITTQNQELKEAPPNPLVNTNIL